MVNRYQENEGLTTVTSTQWTRKEHEMLADRNAHSCLRQAPMILNNDNGHKHV